MDIDIKKNKTIILLSLALALMLHGALLFFLYDISISSDLIAEKAIAFERSQNKKTTEEIEIKNQQLQSAFSRWSKPRQDALPVALKVDEDSFNIDMEASLAAVDHFAALDDEMADSFSKATRQFTVPASLGSPQLLQNVWEETASTNNSFSNGTKAIKNAQASVSKDPAKPNLINSRDYRFQVDYAQISPDEGYLFRLLLSPQPEHTFKRIRQNYYFLIDRSHSIDKARYQYVKQAVAEALTRLKKEDTFNILVFDNKLVSMAEENIPVTSASISYATEWLQQRPHGGFFASTDLYTSLMKIIPDVVDEQEVHTAILFSDGDTLLSREEQRLSIGRWNDHNRGKVSLYCIASGKKNNLALLSLISTFNRGSLYYTGRHDETPSLLAELMQTIDQPIGKDLVVTAIQGKMREVEDLYPRREKMSQLYVHQPLLLYGKIDSLDDLHLFVQGKYYDRRFDIEQKIVFSRDRQVPLDELSKGWVIHKANDYYALYLEDGDYQHLKEAGRLLAAERFPVAFQ